MKKAVLTQEHPQPKLCQPLGVLKKATLSLLLLQTSVVANVDFCYENLGSFRRLLALPCTHGCVAVAVKSITVVTGSRYYLGSVRLLRTKDFDDLFPL